ncbi:MAG: ABC transporter substrate-binding protein [Bauldia sp.]|nr:ABC transporter substrate-binding protein [Bauldia sp.]
MQIHQALAGLSPFLLALGAALSPAQAQAPATEEVTLLLDWFVNPDHAPLVIAKEGGYFEREGLDVEIIAPADPSTPPRLVAAREADVAVTYQPDLMLNINEGLPLLRFGTLIENPLNCLIVLKNGPVQSLSDLRGKRIGYSTASMQDAYLNAILGSVGLTVADVELINVNWNLATALMSGQVEAAIDGYRNIELTQLELQGFEAMAFFPEEHGVPLYDELIYVTHSDNREAPWLASFTEAVEQASAWMTNHPDEAWQMFVAAHADLDDELNRRMFFDTIPRFALRPGALDTVRYERFAAFMQANEVIEALPPVDTYAIQPR